VIELNFNWRFIKIMPRYYKVNIKDEKTGEIIFSFRALVSKKEQRSGRFSFKSDVDEDLYVSSFELLDNNQKVIMSKNETELTQLINLRTNLNELILKKGTYLIDK
jgi:hypothetical protein